MLHCYFCIQKVSLNDINVTTIIVVIIIYVVLLLLLNAMIVSTCTSVRIIHRNIYERVNNMHCICYWAWQVMFYSR